MLTFPMWGILLVWVNHSCGGQKCVCNTGNLKKPVFWFCLNSLCLCLLLTSGYVPVHDWVPKVYTLKIWVGGKCHFFIIVWCLILFCHCLYLLAKSCGLWGGDLFLLLYFQESLYLADSSLFCTMFLLLWEYKNVNGFLVVLLSCQVIPFINWALWASRLAFCIIS